MPGPLRLPGSTHDDRIGPRSVVMPLPIVRGARPRRTQRHLGLDSVVHWPRAPEDDQILLGLGLLSRWPISRLQQIEMPARHRSFAPVAMVATLGHPAGPLHVIIACLEYEPAYNDDRIAQAETVADLATDPDLDGPADRPHLLPAGSGHSASRWSRRCWRARQWTAAIHPITEQRYTAQELSWSAGS